MAKGGNKGAVLTPLTVMISMNKGAVQTLLMEKEQASEWNGLRFSKQEMEMASHVWQPPWHGQVDLDTIWQWKDTVIWFEVVERDKRKPPWGVATG